MQILNYNGYNAKELADIITAAAPEFRAAGTHCMSVPDAVKFTVERWLWMDKSAKEDPEARKILQQLYTALAYMGSYRAVIRLENYAHYDVEDAMAKGDPVAIAQAEEAREFWRTVLHLYSEVIGGDTVHLAYNLLHGIGCEEDAERAKAIYEEKYFARFASFSDEKRSKLRDAVDGNAVCYMPQLRRRIITALLDGDREEFRRAYDEALETEGGRKCIDSVLSFTYRFRSLT